MTDSIVKRSADQRQAQPGEPTCTVCRRYGEFVCDATNEDVCSLECRDICVSRQQLNLQSNRQLDGRADELRYKLGINISIKSPSETAARNFSATRWPIPIVEFDQDQEGVELPKELLSNLNANGFERPTPVQMQTIPCVLEGHNMLVSALTGSGKTASYLIPVITQSLLAREKKEEILALVLAPVRELAIQIETVAKALMKGIADMKTALLVGGFPVPTQRYRLQNGVQLIVATPGRFLDIFTNYSGGDSILPGIRTCVVDEVDTMLGVGFRPQISQIVALLGGERTKNVQLVFLSATVSHEVETLVQQLLKSRKEQTYVRVDVRADKSKTGENFVLNPSVRHHVRWSADKAKKNELFEFLKGKSEESTLVFVGSKVGATLLAQAIEKRCGIGAAAIHADKTQQERLRLLESFVNLEIPVLVSTNVLSRGMDLLNVENVVVYDFPKKVADYVHLIGRVGRGVDVLGNALTLVNLGDRPLFRELVPLLRQAKVSVPREVHQNIHSEDTKTRARPSDKVVVDECKRAFRFREKLVEERSLQTSDWKEWERHNNKRRRTQPGNHDFQVATSVPLGSGSVQFRNLCRALAKANKHCLADFLDNDRHWLTSGEFFEMVCSIVEPELGSRILLRDIFVLYYQMRSIYQRVLPLPEAGGLRRAVSNTTPPSLGVVVTASTPEGSRSRFFPGLKAGDWKKLIQPLDELEQHPMVQLGCPRGRVHQTLTQVFWLRRCLVPVVHDLMLRLFFGDLIVGSRLFFMLTSNPNAQLCVRDGCDSIETLEHCFLTCPALTQMWRTLWSQWRRAFRSTLEWKILLFPSNRDVARGWRDDQENLLLLWKIHTAIVFHAPWRLRNDIYFGETQAVTPNIANLQASFRSHCHFLFRRSSDWNIDGGALNRVLTRLGFVSELTELLPNLPR